ncbi:MAG: amino acid adenylation domain-containing protein [Lachnospiraceae bacterium]|nr:amino acid adenylation domain-containing protein [Lachnospiraceae bacterium]
MRNSVLCYLEDTAKKFPDKIAFADEGTALSFREFQKRAMRVGTCLAKRGMFRKPVIVYMKKSPDLLAAFFGVVYSGCFYVPIDEEMPKRRIELILQNTQAEILICDEEMRAEAESLSFEGNVLLYTECQKTEVDEKLLAGIRSRVLDVDPVYIFYTSGSTGIPKGVVGCHRGIIDYTEQLSEVLGFDETCVFANQTPLYWDASMKEVYATLKHGATTYLVPKSLFMFPVKLVEYLNRYQVNTICWVVSALTMISAFGTFEIVQPEYLKLVAFCGEVFPVKQFNIWKKQLPDAEFYNLYGPTETTGVSTYYHANRLFGENEVIPIGRAFANTQILLLDEAGQKVQDGEAGEICIRGSGVTLGYYHDMDKTRQVFVQNPENPYYIDLMYRTGDLARKDEEGNFVFVSRQDHQIKHMGHRIELGEIEADVGLVEGVNVCCCIYAKEKNKIVLFYVGDLSKAALTRELKARLPRYMLPNAIFQLEDMPLTINGKMDRMRLQEIYKDSVSRKK